MKVEEHSDDRPGKSVVEFVSECRTNGTMYTTLNVDPSVFADPLRNYLTKFQQNWFNINKTVEKEGESLAKDDAAEG